MFLCVYWSLPISAIVYRVRWLSFKAKRHDSWELSKYGFDIFQVKLLKTGEGELYRDGPCMYLANHRSWCDFFFDSYITEGRGQMLSRFAVCYVFPIFMACAKLLQATIIFKRRTLTDREGFNNWLDQQIAESPLAGVVVYPEGHRNPDSTSSLSLRRGMLVYAYSRKMPCQIVISAGKDAVWAEKHFKARLGRPVVSAFSKTILSGDYATFDEFYADLLVVWNETWQRAYTAYAYVDAKLAASSSSAAFKDGDDKLPVPPLELYQVAHIPYRLYSMPVALCQAALVLVSFCCMFGFLFLCGLLCKWIWGIGLAGQILLVVMALVVLVSFARCVSGLAGPAIQTLVPLTPSISKPTAPASKAPSAPNAAPAAAPSRGPVLPPKGNEPALRGASAVVTEISTTLHNQADKKDM